MKLPSAGIAIEQAPLSLADDAREYLQRIIVQISGQFENMEKEIQDLQKRVDKLEKP